MITGSLIEPTTIAFELAVSGIDNMSGAEVLFSIVTPEVIYSFPAQHTQQHEYVAIIPALKNVLSQKEYNCKIHLFLGSKVFTPFTGTILMLDENLDAHVNLDKEPVTEPEVHEEPVQEPIPEKPVVDLTTEKKKFDFDFDFSILTEANIEKIVKPKTEPKIEIKEDVAVEPEQKPSKPKFTKKNVIETQNTKPVIEKVNSEPLKEEEDSKIKIKVNKTTKIIAK